LSRNLSAFTGLIIAAIVWKISTAHHSLAPEGIGWFLPVLFSYLTYSIVAPLVLVLTADLHLKAPASVPSAADSLPGHDAAHREADLH
jgi:hypothetical protein